MEQKKILELNLYYEDGKIRSEISTSSSLDKETIIQVLKEFIEHYESKKD